MTTQKKNQTMPGIAHPPIALPAMAASYPTRSDLFTRLIQRSESTAALTAVVTARCKRVASVPSDLRQAVVEYQAARDNYEKAFHFQVSRAAETTVLPSLIA
jgi:hypothetical protein